MLLRKFSIEITGFLVFFLSVYSEICFQIYRPEDTSSIAFFAVVHTVSGLLILTYRFEL